MLVKMGVLAASLHHRLCIIDEGHAFNTAVANACGHPIST